MDPINNSRWHQNRNGGWQNYRWSLSKKLVIFLTQQMQLKSNYKKRLVVRKNVNAIAMDRWAKEREAADSEEELREWITQIYGRSKWLELLKIRREVLQEKREAEAQARREAIERQEMMITIAGIVVLLLFSCCWLYGLFALYGLD